MKQSIFFNLLKGASFILLFVLSSAVSAAAQSGKDIDISEKVAKLPKRDGTFLLHNEKGTRLYGIKKGGQIVEHFVIDKQGNPVEFEIEESSSSPSTETNGEVPSVGAKKKCVCVTVFGVKACYCW